MKPAQIQAEFGADQEFCAICDKAFVDGPDAEFVVKLHKNQFGNWVALPYHYACYERDPMRALRETAA